MALTGPEAEDEGLVIAKVIEDCGSNTVRVFDGNVEHLCLVRKQVPFRIVRGFFVSITKGGLGRDTKILHEVSQVFVGKDLEDLQRSELWPEVFCNEIASAPEEKDPFEDGNPNKPKNFIVEESDSD